MIQRYTKDGKKIEMDKMKKSNRSVIVDGKAAPKCTANIKTYGNIWTRELSLNKGEAKAGHKHEFDHLHFLASGSVSIRVYNKHDKKKLLVENEYTAPSWIKVPKEHFHDIIALEDNTLGYCIQAIRNEDGEVLGTDYTKDYLDVVNNFEETNGMVDETPMD